MQARVSSTFDWARCQCPIESLDVGRRLDTGAIKHRVTDDFDPDGMSMAINMTIDFEVTAAPSAAERLPGLSSSCE